MEQPSSRKRFIFNKKIDHEFIFSLYEDDFEYLVQVFETSLESLGPDLQILYDAYADSNLQDMKRAIHKIKPVFGFTGLLQHQAAIENFQKRYASETDTLQLASEYEELLKGIYDGRRIIEEEYERLNKFIG